LIETYASGQHPRRARWSAAKRSGSNGGLGLLVHIPIPGKQVGDFVGGVIWKPGQHVPPLMAPEQIDVVNRLLLDDASSGAEKRWGSRAKLVACADWLAILS
jgi:hypothetical protein